MVGFGFNHARIATSLGRYANYIRLRRLIGIMGSKDKYKYARFRIS